LICPIILQGQVKSSGFITTLWSKDQITITHSEHTQKTVICLVEETNIH